MYVVENEAGLVPGLVDIRTAEIALWCAVNYTALYGADSRVRRVLDSTTRYRVEADSKVDLADRYFPVIVHVAREAVAA